MHLHSTNLFLLLLVSECRVEGCVRYGRPERRHCGQLERLGTHQPERLILNLQLWRVVCHFLVISVIYQILITSVPILELMSKSLVRLFRVDIMLFKE